VNAAVYGYGSAAIFVITVASLCGLLIVRIRTTAAYYHLINLMLGLGIGTLVGDAFLHLIPHVCVCTFPKVAVFVGLRFQTTLRLDRE